MLQIPPPAGGRNTYAPTDGVPTNELPHSLQAEQALLGALLIDNRALDDLELLPDHFFEELHGAIYAAMQTAHSAGRKFTATTLAPQFRRVGVDEETNGAQYLGRLLSNATTTINVREYARTIIELSQRRALMIVAEDLMLGALDARDPVSVSGLIAEAEARLLKVSTVGKNGREIEFASALDLVLDEMRIAAENKGRIRGVETGFCDLDKRLGGGLGNGNVIVLAGRPAMGKTALALNIASNVAGALNVDALTGEVIPGRGGFVHFFSQEMTAVELARRQLSGATKIPSNLLRTGQVSDQEFGLVEAGIRNIRDLPIFIDESGALTFAALAAKARRAKRRFSTRLIVIDYLQLMAGSGSYRGNRVQDITEITTGLKGLAKELDVPILLLSQLNREVEKRDNKRPQLSDLRESGSIEQDADVVLFVHREEYYLAREEPTDKSKFQEWQDKLNAAKGLAEVVIAKQRHGEPGTVELTFDGLRTQFDNFTRREVER